MNEEQLYTIFQDSITIKMQVGETLFPAMVQAAHMMVNCLLEEGKILTCGNGASAAMAQILTNGMMSRAERERPSLPAITIGADSVNVTSIANEAGLGDVFAKPIRALGQAGDILVVFSASGNPSNLVQAIQAAHERHMNVIIFNGGEGGNITSLLDVNDKEIRVPSATKARIHEVHLLMIFCLCDLIDEQLFGPLES